MNISWWLTRKLQFCLMCSKKFSQQPFGLLICYVSEAVFCPVFFVSLCTYIFFISLCIFYVCLLAAESSMESTVPQKMTDSTIRHLTMDNSLCLLGSFYYSHSPSVQPGVDFPLTARFREVGYSPVDLKHLNNIWTSKVLKPLPFTCLLHNFLPGLLRHLSTLLSLHHVQCGAQCGVKCPTNPIINNFFKVLHQNPSYSLHYQ